MIKLWEHLVGDEIITDNQINAVLKKFTGGSLEYNFGGSSNKSVTAIGGGIQYRQPIIENKVDLLIQGAGHYVDWGKGHHKGIDYRGVGLEIRF